MTPRSAQQAISAFTIVAVASVGLALANLTWRLAGYAGTSPVAVPVSAGSSDGSDIRPLIALQPFGAAIAAGSATGGTSIQLRAVLLSSPIELSVVLIAGPDGKVAPYLLGQAVGDGVIEAIQVEQIVLRTATGQRIVGFNPEPALASAASPAAAQATASPGAAPTQAAPLTGAAAIRALIPESSQGIRPPSPAPPPASVPPAPAPQGYRVSGTNPALAATGIRAGDVVLSVNGRAVSSGASESDLMAQAMSAGAARLEILRDGSRVSLTVPIR